MLCICDYTGLEMEFDCSKLLPSSQADHDYIFLLCILSRNLSEPFWSRAQQQLQFRNSDFPLANVLVRLLILDDEMESQMRSWFERLYRTSSEEAAGVEDRWAEQTGYKAESKNPTQGCGE